MESLTIEEIWRIMVDPPMIAGPWIPYRRKCYRYNHVGHPIAMVSHLEEVKNENVRLENLGYKLTDKNRKLPGHFFTFTELPSEEK